MLVKLSLKQYFWILLLPSIAFLGWIIFNFSKYNDITYFLSLPFYILHSVTYFPFAFLLCRVLPKNPFIEKWVILCTDFTSSGTILLYLVLFLDYTIIFYIISKIAKNKK
ncbi:hypothetical protein HYX00_02380 [Candidatus Woesearchaeota archaeon]|nr:hypothetical protein [Candidatus Woesearchaeota archaeon]